MKSLKRVFPKFLATVAGAGVLVLMAAGSGTTYQSLTNWSRVPIDYGTLVNKNVRIESTGSSWSTPWSVNGGEDFTTPFSVYWWQNNGPSMDDNTILNQYQAAYERGARPVLIYVDGQTAPIHGLIVFNDAIGAAFGPARQSYYLQIPEDKLRQTMSGNITVAYENISYKGEWRNDSGYQTENYKWYSWILWMSRTPLVNDGRVVGGSAGGR